MERRPNVQNLIVSCFFIGYSPVLPGTCASLFTSIFIYLFPFLTSSPFFPLSFLVFSFFAIKASKPKEKDPRFIVIDECAGMFITMLWQKITVFSLFFGFVFFRLFDILKPFPVKEAEKLKGAKGILLDDVIAALYANLLLKIIGRML